MDVSPREAGISIAPHRLRVQLALGLRVDASSADLTVALLHGEHVVVYDEGTGAHDAGRDNQQHGQQLHRKQAGQEDPRHVLEQHIEEKVKLLCTTWAQRVEVADLHIIWGRGDQ